MYPQVADRKSGGINWLLEVIAPEPTAVITSFKQVAKKGELRQHLVVTWLVGAKEPSRCARKR